MYALSSEAKKNIQSYTISGTIGSLSFDDENVLKGSLAITNQCVDLSTFNLGGVYIGQMSCSFIGVNIPRNEWIGKEITLSVTINNVQTIPVGVFYVDKAEHSKGMTSVTAYDAMNKFDKALDNTSTLNDYPYTILNWICTQCGVILGMSQADVEALPNGDELIFATKMGDIETYRDLLYWITQTLGGFATIDRSGHLVVRTYHDVVDDSINYDVRFNTSQYGDEIVSFSGFYWTNEETGDMEYEHSTPDNGYAVSLGINPFFQSAMRALYIDDILATLGRISYNACSVTIPFGIHYDLGDVLMFPNGQGSSTNKFCVMGYTWSYYGGYKITSIAVPKTSKSKTDKNITALIRQGDSNLIRYYLISNIADINVGDGETKDIVDLYFTAEKGTTVVFAVELHCEVETTVDGDDYYDAVAQFKYYFNTEELENFEPIETWQDGNHIKHLLYHFTVQEPGTKRIQVKLTMSGGSVHIDINNARGAIYGQGLVASDEWNGVIKIDETVSAFDLVDISVADVSDSVLILTLYPEIISNTDIVTSFNLEEISVINVTEAINVVTHSDTFPMVTEDGISLITEDGYRFYTEGDS